MSDEYRLSLSYPNPSLSETMVGQHSTNTSEGGMSDVKGSPDGHPRGPVAGAQQVILMISLLTGLLISTLDTSIVSTSLVTISKDLDDFVNASWVVLAYLLTYMGFAVCIAKLSDIYGRKNMLVLCWVIFISFSLGCGSAKSMGTLIACRCFQGIGGSGLYSLTQIGLVEVGPVHRPSLIGAMVGMTLAVSFVSGPLIGGVISHYSDWRWLFNMNIPIGLMAILGITNLWPQEDVAHLFSWDAFKTIDFLGNIALHLASGLVVFALQQAGSQSSAWESPEIISTFIISGMCFAGFVWWEIALGSKRFGRIEPVFPMRLILNRVYSSGLMVTMLTGFPYIALTIIIPERFQIVDGQDALTAGIHILPMLGACAVGSFLGGTISSKRNNTSYTMVGASALQLLGVSLMTMVSRSPSGAQYAYQAIFGLGVGLSISSATIMTNVFASEQADRASAQGAVAQARVFGGCIGLALCTVIFNSHVNRFLASHLSEQEIEDLHRSPLAGLQLPLNQRELVKSVYAGAFAEQIRVMAVICAVMVAVALFSLERHPTPLRRPTPVTKDADSSRRGSDSATELNDVASVRLQTV